MDEEPDHQIAQMLAGEPCYQYETQRRCKDGTIIDVLLTISPWHLDGRVVGVTSIAIDLSERKRDERARDKAIADFEEAQRIAAIGSWSWNPTTDEGHWSSQMYEIFGREPADGPATNEAFYAYIHPEDREPFLAAYESARGGPDAFEIDFRITAGDGTRHTVHGRGHHDHARPGWYVGTVQDVTDLRRAEEELRHSEERLRTSFHGAPTGVALVEAGPPFTVLQVNSALAEMLGSTPDWLVGSSALTIIDEAQRGLVNSKLRRLIDRAGRSVEVEVELELDDATAAPVWINVTGAVITDVDGRPEDLVLHMQNITDRKRYEAELRTLVERDPLTSLLNRRRMEDELHRMVAENNRYRTPATVLICDVDNLKLINDTLGHKAGDQLIKAVGGVLSARVRESDIIARTGGDEFAVLMPQTGLEQARVLAERLRDGLLDLELTIGPHRVQTTLSIGIAPVGDGLSVEDSLAAADLAMYESKRHGRNRVYASNHALSTDVMTQQLSWLGRLRSALADERFELYAQPIIGVADRAVRCRELLLRMHDEDGALLMPAAFIPTAERFGIIADIDRWVVCSGSLPPTGRAPSSTRSTSPACRSEIRTCWD
jgi:diguanylate cyclase (GGDEF)-like protein/PAS domain S-box-containing protein